MKLKPLGDKIILKTISKEEKTKAGIILPDTVEKDKPDEGEIIAVGPGKVNDEGKRIPIDVKVGEKVIFKKYGFDDYEIDGKKYLIGDADDIIAVVK